LSQKQNGSVEPFLNFIKIELKITLKNGSFCEPFFQNSFKNSLKNGSFCEPFFVSYILPKFA